MSNEPSEIAKLTERISKDPKSKLFLPLAEEYKKAGDIEMAIHVLSEGIGNNPGYITARSVLGKLLLEKGELEGARKEYEEVVKAIPDNLMAQRNLGNLYLLQNKPDEAVKHLRVALSLNPRDEELAALISNLEAGPDASPKPEPEPATTINEEAPLVPVSESEEAEEVLFVEPLEDEDLEPAEAMEFAAGEPVADAPVMVEADRETSAATGGAPDVSAEKSDEFTTDTLAELYIAQGFHEKAIDIYERMLADHPESEGLKDKLKRVREAAAQTASAWPASPEAETEPGLWEEGFPGEPENEGEPRAADTLVTGEEIPAATTDENRDVESGEELAPPVLPTRANKEETIARLENWLRALKKKET